MTQAIYPPPPPPQVPVPREIEVTLANGVVGTLAIPHSVDADNPFVDGYAPSTHKVALILHGQYGHRNYCYQRVLAHRLAADLGVYSLRIDFRGCGDSADNADDSVGRVFEQDVQDIQAAAEYLVDGTKNALNINFTLSSIIAHSRGSVAMFLWALEQNKLVKANHASRAIVVPNLINCSGRFNSPRVYERYPKDWSGVEVKVIRHGKPETSTFVSGEIVSLASADLEPVRDLTLDWSVMTIFGLQDIIVPVEDSTMWANALNRGPHSHTLKLIEGADHNFYGVHQIENLGDAEDYNPKNFPINSKKLVNYNFLVTDMIIEYLQPEEELKRFASSNVDVGKLPRWKEVEGVNNFRDMGGWQITEPRYTIENAEHYYVKPHTLFRCANMSNITTNGLKTLQRLGIKTIFDLRSDGECDKAGPSKDLEKYGIKRIHTPIYKQDDYSPQAIAVRYTHLMTSWYTYVNVYQDMLEMGVSAFKTIFEYIRDVNEPFVFHCTAGKDRTGMIGMLILLLLGVDKHTISKEYELTTIGLKPEIPVLKSAFAETVSKLRAKMQSTVDIEQIIGQGRKDWNVEEEGFKNLISSRYEAMLSTIEMFNNKYGGIVDYLKSELKFTEEDIYKIYQNLVIVDENFSHSSTLNWHHRKVERSKI
ncbi:alpha/beta-hydrolase [Suhomyces tanzawaensis NRRL Y-17324]|uniref:Alpha/beta-hydrolase n=1 Tax=Suhomyces tanzawaensis NRRL Y-17324 TaxID=984487 RepID=A0A1E4SMU5_9ASCO|nr:alpha/beta-hydrolase [Suhomyces tanzawaensis NRRL Y-17324]ODV80843.1 alpha/beta-hydrolase [Suhomyces tanzawaensis NRRL Y-17324]